jgi:hypothetical protein
MGLTVEQLVEYALIRAFPNQNEEGKKLYRYELESWVPGALTRVARKVAEGPDYKKLQRDVVIDLQWRTRPVPYCELSTGMASASGNLVGTSGSYALSYQRAPIRTNAVRSWWVEWQLVAAKSVTFGLIEPLTPTRTNRDTWFVSARYDSGSGTVGVYLGAAVQAASIAVEVGDIWRFEWDAAGALTFKRLDADHQVRSTHTIALGGAADTLTPIVLSNEDGASVSVGAVGDTLAGTVNEPYRAALVACPNLILDSISARGRVEFEGAGKALQFVESMAQRHMKKMCGQWYYSIEGEDIYAWPAQSGAALPSERLVVVGNIVPRTDELPYDLHEAAIQAVVEIARERVGDVRGAAYGRATRQAAKIESSGQATPATSAS